MRVIPGGLSVSLFGHFVIPLSLVGLVDGAFVAIRGLDDVSPRPVSYVGSVFSGSGIVCF